jgi:DNA polymerase III delta prime subunit
MNKNFNICQISSNNGTIHCLKTYSLVKYKINQNHIEMDIIGSDGFIMFMKKSIADQYEIVNANIDWIYSTNGDSVSIPLTSDRMPVDEMYPFINRPIQEYYDDYMNSSASILLLFGPPGTGKTTFIRGLLQHSSKSAMVTYDSAILEKDFIFSSFIEGDSSIFIIEDADLFLKSRQEGNTMMHKFLNVGDGLVSTKEKKMIFSTNLPSVRDIDPALVRAGRCYDIVEFRNLTIDEGTKLSKKMNIDSDFGNKKEISLAEIFHPENGKKLSTSTKKSKVGFI